VGGDVEDEVDNGEPSEEDEATEGDEGTICGGNGMDIGWTGDVACVAGSSMSQSEKILLSKTVDLHCSSRSKRKLSVSFECLLCVGYMAERRRGGDGKEGRRMRGNGERTEATRRGFICRGAISLSRIL
jgi:hypothetical protein